MTSSEPACPYCGVVMGDSADLCLGDGGHTTVECEACEREYYVVAAYSVIYTTSEVARRCSVLSPVVQQRAAARVPCLPGRRVHQWVVTGVCRLCRAVRTVGRL